MDTWKIFTWTIGIVFFVFFVLFTAGVGRASAQEPQYECKELITELRTAMEKVPQIKAAEYTIVYDDERVSLFKDNIVWIFEKEPPKFDDIRGVFVMRIPYGFLASFIYDNGCTYGTSYRVMGPSMPRLFRGIDIDGLDIKHIIVLLDEAGDDI